MYLLPTAAVEGSGREAGTGSAEGLSGYENESGNSGPGAYLFDRIGKKDGLAHNAVSGIVQDRRGYLWFGTQNGLCRYDGRNFRTWEHRPFDDSSLPHNLIQTIYLDPVDPWLWVGTYEGLTRFDLEDESFTHFKGNREGRTFSNEVVTSMVRDPENRLWVGTLNGLNRLDLETGLVESYLHSEEEEGSLLNNTVRSLLLDRKGRLWVGGYGGLDLYRGESDTFLHYPGGPGELLPSPYVMALCETGSGLWLGTWDGGLVRLDPDTGRITEHLPMDGENIYLLDEDRSGELWIGTWGGGLYRWSGKMMTRFEADPDDPYKLSQGIIYSFFRDRGGVYWIGTNGRGVNKLNPRKKDFRFLHHIPGRKDSLPPDRIRSILIDSRERFWVSSYSRGLWRFAKDGDRWQVRNWMPDADDPRAVSHKNIIEVMEDSRGRIWVGSLGGIDRYIPGTDDFSPLSLAGYGSTPDAEPFVYALQEDVDGSVWVGTGSHGLIHLSPDDRVIETFRFDPGAPELSNNLVYCMLLDSRGRLWVGTNRGLNLYKREEGRFESFLHDSSDRRGLSSNVISDLYEDSAGRLWICTGGGGLNYLIPGESVFHHISTEDGLVSNQVQAVQEDREGRLWISTVNGISVLDPEDMSLRSIDESDGIMVDEMYTSSAVDRKGRIYFGSSQGILRFDSAILHDNPHPPALWMNDVQVMGKSVDFSDALHRGRELVLGWDQSFISFEFAALDYTSPLQNRYRYRMEGLGRGWVNSGSRNYASYQSLPPGHYVFRVQASNNDGVWNESGLSLPLYVKAPPWKQGWFRSLYILAALLTIVFISNMRVNSMLKKKLNRAEDRRVNLQAMNDRLELMAWRDALTGLSNRRYFDLSLNNLWYLAARERRPLTMLMIDIDHFKAYNDFYGHQEGDEALKKVASLIRSIVRRESDAVCRYGGEEFTVLLFDTDGSEGERMARDLLQRVREAAVPHQGSATASYVTLSVGIAGCVPGAGDEPELLLSIADDALYEAKNSGRDKAVVKKWETRGEL